MYSSCANPVTPQLQKSVFSVYEILVRMPCSCDEVGASQACRRFLPPIKMAVASSVPHNRPYLYRHISRRSARGSHCSLWAIGTRFANIFWYKYGLIWTKRSGRPFPDSRHSTLLPSPLPCSSHEQQQRQDTFSSKQVRDRAEKRVHDLRLPIDFG